MNEPQKTKYLFSHGLADSGKRQSKHYQPIILHDLAIFDYPDASSNIFRLNRTQTSLAQENEIECLAEAYFKDVCNAIQSVLLGVSRGASALINFMALYNPENVGALILESPFDCVDNIVWQFAHQSKFSWIPGIKKSGTKLASFIFCKYKPNGLRPIDLVGQIRKDLPILIVCSAQDNLVPVWSSINLYCTLRATDHDNVYLLVLPEGSHAKLITNKIYGPLYHQVTHAFYQKFNLPHDPAAAHLGQPLLKMCQPDSTTLRYFYPQPLVSSLPTKPLRK